jgi:hypothetical protein
MGTTADVAADPQKMLKRYQTLQASTQIAASNQQAVNETNRPALLSGDESQTKPAITNMQNAANATASLAQSAKQAREEIMALPNDIKENIGGIMQELQDVMQERAAKIGAAGGLMEKILTSTPQDLKRMGNTFNNLNRTLAGKGVSFQESKTANIAYNQVRKQGGSHMQGQRAAQEAYAQESGDTLSMAKELAPLLGAVDPDAQNKMMASVYENMFAARGMDTSQMKIGDKSMKDYIEMMKKGAGEDPKVKALNDALIAQQAALREAAAAANEVLMKEKGDIIAKTGEVIFNAMQQGADAVKKAMEEAAAAGITPPGETGTAAMTAEEKQKAIEQNNTDIKNLTAKADHKDTSEEEKAKLDRQIAEKRQENYGLGHKDESGVNVAEGYAQLPGETPQQFTERKAKLERRVKGTRPPSAPATQSAAANVGATPSPPVTAPSAASGATKSAATNAGATPYPPVEAPSAASGEMTSPAESKASAAASAAAAGIAQAGVANAGATGATRPPPVAGPPATATQQANANATATAAPPIPTATTSSQPTSTSAPKPSQPMGLANIHQEAHQRGMSVDAVREERRNQYQQAKKDRRKAYEERKNPQVANAPTMLAPGGMGTSSSNQVPEQAPKSGTASVTPPSSNGQPVSAPRPIASAQQQNQGTGVLSNNGFEVFANKLDTLLTKLAEVNIPTEIRLTSENLGVNVTLNGGEVMANLPDQLKKSIIAEVAETLRNYDRNTTGEGTASKPGVIGSQSGQV